MKKVKFRPRMGHKAPEGGSRYSPTLSLASALHRGEWSTPDPIRFTPGKEAYCIGGWAEPQNRSERVQKTSPHRDWIPGPSRP